MSPAPSGNWYCVYLLRSKKDGLFYLGCISNLRKGLREHKGGMNYSTKKMLPIELIYVEAYKSKKDAFGREKRLKQYGSAMGNLKLRLSETLRNGKRDEGSSRF